MSNGVPFMRNRYIRSTVVDILREAMGKTVGPCVIAQTDWHSIEFFEHVSMRWSMVPCSSRSRRNLHVLPTTWAGLRQPDFAGRGPVLFSLVSAALLQVISSTPVHYKQRG